MTGTLKDEEVLAQCAPDDLIKLIGPSGSGLAIDTCRCLHFGARSRGQDRLILMFNFTRHDHVMDVGIPVPAAACKRYAKDRLRRLVCNS